MKRVSWFLFISFLSFSQTLTLIQIQTAEDIALKAEAKLRSYRSFQANFEQTYYSSSISTPLKEKGKFYFKKPDLMKWEYKEPEEKFFLVKDGFFWDYNREENQLIKYDISREGNEFEILSLLSGQRGILDNYTVEFNPFPTNKPKAHQVKLKPKEEDPDTFILLEIDEKTWLIQKAIFFDWASNKTEYHFSRIKINVTFPKNTFELDVPHDVEIIENKIR